MRIIIFIFVLILVFASLHYYVHKRFVEKAYLRRSIKRAFNIFLILNFLGVLAYALTRYYPFIPNWLYFVFSLPIGIIFLMFCWTLIYDAFNKTLSLPQISQSKRDFFRKSLDIISVGALFGLNIRAVSEAQHIVFEDVDIKIKNLKKQYSIVQLSDIHIGGLIDAGFIKSIVSKINASEPDLVVITGDLVDIEIKYARSALNELAFLKSKYGTYFIVGNHEYFHDIAEILKTVKSLGIKVLENDSVYIGEKDSGFNLAGVYDMFGYRTLEFVPDLKKALKHTLAISPTVLLAHQPLYIQEVENKNVDLMLSGHTHGGQLYPFRLLVKMQQPYIAGLYNHNDRLQIYVNRGTGYWGPPMRLGVSSEITNIKLLPS